ncbi:MAG: hypothetical protein H7Y37_05380 [Anaerolineae bacterium]|nr:hypothetical protein [Gloeobacterales cyanobacterium ES-bin-313]
MKKIVAPLLLALCLLPATAANATEEVLTLDSSLDQGVYSRVFVVNSAYMLKDKDYVPNESYLGLFTNWSYSPEANNPFQVRARYCLPYPGGADAATAQLVGLDLLDEGKVLVAMQGDLNATPANVQVIRPAYYEPGSYRLGPTFIGRGFYQRSYYQQSAPVYHPALSCVSGNGSFDLSPVASTLATLPDKTLKIRLRFDNGETSNWQLGSGTVRELKKLVGIREKMLAP